MSPDAEVFANGVPVLKDVGYRHDGLRLAFTALHVAVVGYVVAGWMVESRPFLLAYLLVLPSVALQWLLNGGSSALSNIENLMRSGRWRDRQNGNDGIFFQSLLAECGIEAPNWLINLVLCSTMFVLWTTALLRMVMITANQ